MSGHVKVYTNIIKEHYLTNTAINFITRHPLFLHRLVAVGSCDVPQPNHYITADKAMHKSVGYIVISRSQVNSPFLCSSCTNICKCNTIYLCVRR